MTAYYDYSILTEKKILNEKDYILAWSQICEGLGKGGKDYGTVSMHPRKNAKEKWFNASADQNHVLIQKAEISQRIQTLLCIIGFAQWNLK